MVSRNKMNNAGLPFTPPTGMLVWACGRVAGIRAGRWLLMAVLLAGWIDLTDATGPGLAATAGAEPRRPVPVPIRSDLASVRDIEVEVLRGRSIDIILAATVPTTQTPDFFLRSQPQAGTLGELERVEGQPLRARVRYTAPDAPDAVTDQFTFAARLPGGPMSAAAVVRIRILEPQPLMTGEPLVIEDVPLGHARTGMLVVTNRGEGPWREVVRLPEPWSAPAGVIEVQPGQRVEVPVSFRPTNLDTQRHEFSLQPGLPDSSVLLVGRGVPSFSLTPSRRLSLVPKPETGERGGILRIEAPAPVMVRLSSDEAGRLGLPDQLQVDANQPAVIPLVLAADDLAVLDTMITVTSDFTQLSLAVAADAVAGKIVIEPLPPDRVLDLGTLVFGEQTERSLVLRNKGGTGLRLKIEAERPAFVSQPVGSTELAPGQDVDVVVGLHASTVGLMERRISIDTGAGVETLTLVAEVHAPEPDPSEVIVPRMGGGAATWDDILAAREGGEALRRWASSAMVEGVRIEAVETNDSLPQIQSLRATAVGRSWIDLQWPVPSPETTGASEVAGSDDWNYVVEIARVMPHPDSGEIGHFWLKVPDRDFKWKTSGDRTTVAARVRSLPHSSPVVARVAVRASSGAIGPVSSTTRAVTKGSRPLPWGRIGFGLLLIAAAVLGFLVRRQRRQA